MIVLKIALLVIFTVAYGFAIGYLIYADKPGKLAEFADIILVSACLTSIDYMAGSFEVHRFVKILCLVILLLIAILTTLYKKKKTSKTKMDSENQESDAE